MKKGGMLLKVSGYRDSGAFNAKQRTLARPSQFRALCV
jgi:hypothetical protein